MKPLFLLDTNIISELFRNSPDTSVSAKINFHQNRCAIASTTWNELLYGVNIMPEGKRKDFYTSILINIIQSRFQIISLDSHAALIQADIRSRLKEKGTPKDYPDTEIAAIAVSNGMILITRNKKDFEPMTEISPLMLDNWFSGEEEVNE